MTQQTSSKTSRFIVGLLLKVVIPLLIVLAAVGFTKHQMDTRPQAKRKKPPRLARLVTVETVKQAPMLAKPRFAMGPVIPARQVTVMPEVSGLVRSLDPVVIPGGIVKADQVLLTIDARDYEVLLNQSLGQQAQAKLNYKLELGNQKIAQQEFELLSQELVGDERELVLRQPHLASTQAALEAADAAVARARLDLERCSIKAPFNAVIETKHVDVGARVAPNTSLLTLAGTDTYWVEVKLRVDDLKWLKIPTDNEQNGSLARVYHRDIWGADRFREGRVIRLLASLERQGQVARLLVAVDDPLSLLSENQGKPRMLIGSTVRVEITGRELTGGFPVRRELLRDGDYVWIMTEDKTLEIRPVEIEFRGLDFVYVREGLEAGEKLVVTDMSAPVVGMPLRLNGDKPNKPMSKPQGEKS